MRNKLDDKNLKKLFEELEDAAPDVDFSKLVTRRLFWRKFRFSFALHFLVFIVLLAALPFSYQSVAGDFVRFEIVPMFDSILSNFEFSFDFITYQINFIGAFLPFTSILIFSFNLAVFCLVAFFVVRDLKKFDFINRKALQAVITLLLVFTVFGALAGAAFAQVSENSSFDQTSSISPLAEEGAEKSQIVLTAVVDEVNGDMGILIVELRTVNKKELVDLRGDKIAVYTDEETEFVKRGREKAGLADLNEGDKVTIIGIADEGIFWAEKIVAASTPWWKKIFK